MRALRRILVTPAVLVVASCAGTPSAGPSPTPIAVTPIELGDASIVVTVVEVDAASGVAALPATGTPSEEPRAPDCGGSDVDLTAILADKRCRAKRDAPPTPATAATDVRVTLVPSAARVAPGGHVDLTLTVQNGGSIAIPLYFSGDLALSVVVTDDKKNRLSPPAGNAPKNPDPKCAEATCRLPASHLVLPPGGKAHATVGWDAVKTAWPTPGPTGCCTFHVEPVAKGPLAAGTYRLKVPLPYESDRGNPPDPEVEIRVGK